MASKKIDRLSFDATLEELETIVHQLEQGSLPLEEALKQFEQGVHLVRAGQQRRWTIFPVCIVSVLTTVCQHNLNPCPPWRRACAMP